MEPCDDGRSDRDLLLIVEDEPLIRTMLIRVLKGKGFEILEAEDGAQALDILARERSRIAAVVSDVQMPNTDGIKLAMALAAVDPQIPVALMSALPPPPLLADLPNVAHWFVKPFEVEQLADSVRELIECEHPDSH